MVEQTKEKRKRAPKRCLKCPDKPLLSTCALHRFRKPKTVEPPQEDLNRQQQALLPPQSNPDPPQLLQAAVTVPQVAAPGQPLPDFLVDPRLLAEDLLRQQQGSQPPISPSPAVIPPPSSLPPSSRAATPSSPPPSSRAATPSSLPPSSPPPSSPPPSSRAATPAEDDRSSEAESDSDDQVGQKRKNKGKRRQPSGRNATWGVVEGAGRGSDPYPIHRVRELKPVISSQRKATKDLERWTADLLSRCESISTRTGSWLYLAMQHPSSRTPFTHFTSRRLRKDAPEHVQAIHNEVRLTMNALTRADRRARVEVESELQKTQEKLQEAEKRAQHLESKLDALLERLARHENSGILGTQGSASQQHGNGQA